MALDSVDIAIGILLLKLKTSPPDSSDLQDARREVAALTNAAESIGQQMHRAAASTADDGIRYRDIQRTYGIGRR